VGDDSIACDGSENGFVFALWLFVIFVFQDETAERVKVADVK
jgi:hypothetical protein